MVEISNKEKECIMLHISNSEDLEEEKIVEVWRDKTGILCVKYDNGKWYHYNEKMEWW